MKKGMSMKKTQWILSFMLLTALSVQAAQASGEYSIPAISEEAFVSPVPTPMRSNAFVGYELYLTDYISDGYLLESVDILDSDQNGDILRTYSGEELESCTITYNPDKLKYGIVLLLWPSFDSMDDIPAVLAHRLTFTDSHGETIIIGGPQVAISDNPPVVLSPPLAGDNWQAVNGPSNFDRHHRSAVVSFKGNLCIAQRFAVDWMQLGPDGNLFSGDGTHNTDYYCYGTELLAVADGIVIDCKDGIPEHRVDEGMPIPPTSQTVLGNFVILDIGNGLYAFYAHLQPGSVNVQIGDEVSAGDVIGLLGNTGMSTAPHLHFHVEDTSSIIAGQGVPYVLESYELQGTVPVSVDSQFLMEYSWSENDFPETIEGKFFMDNNVVNFP